MNRALGWLVILVIVYFAGYFIGEGLSWLVMNLLAAIFELLDHFGLPTAWYPVVGLPIGIALSMIQPFITAFAFRWFYGGDWRVAALATAAFSAALQGGWRGLGWIVTLAAAFLGARLFDRWRYNESIAAIGERLSGITS